MYFPQTTKLSKCAAYPRFWCFFFSLLYLDWILIWVELSFQSVLYIGKCSKVLILDQRLSQWSLVTLINIFSGASNTNLPSKHRECRGCFPEGICWDMEVLLNGKCWKGRLWSCWESDKHLLLYWGRVLSSRLGKKNLSKRKEPLDGPEGQGEGSLDGSCCWNVSQSACVPCSSS